MAEVMKEAVDLKDEKRIQELCLKAFATNHPKDLKAYYQAASKYFQDRHYRRMSVIGVNDSVGILEYMASV